MNIHGQQARKERITLIILARYMHEHGAVAVDKVSPKNSTNVTRHQR
jgi:hypothetical protein